jgi:ADP-ribosyl-[dinitrogen reductase] hydrolase
MLVSALSSEIRTEILLLAGDAGGDAVRRRAMGAYLGLAVGDALGATVEFLTPNEIRSQHGQHREVIGGGWLRLRKGHVTDDTEMSLALGASILANGGVDPLAAAEAFSDWMRHKPVDIGNTVRRGIATFRRTGVPEMPQNEFDAGNGACMRCLPIALATVGADADQVDACNQCQAHVTHNNPTSDAATLCVIRMVQAALLGGDRNDLKLLADALVAEDAAFTYDRKRSENPSAFIVDTVRAVFQALFATDSFESALIDVVNRGGDADTTGAITGMIAGALYGPAAIPARWVRHLDKRIRHACIEQAQELTKLSPLYAVCLQPR